MPTYLSSANDLLVDLNGKKAYLEDNSLWVNTPSNTTNPSASIQFNRTDLGEPSIDKLINYFDIDYEGEFTIKLYYDDTVDSPIWSSTVNDHGATRDTEWIPLPLINRQAFQKMFIVIIANDASCKIYGIEIDFQVLKRRRL